MTEDTFCKLVARFVEAIHVELSNEAVHLAVSKIARKDHLLKLYCILNHKLFPVCRPVNYLPKLLILPKE